MEPRQLSAIYAQLQSEYNAIIKNPFDDLTDKAIFNQHVNLVCECGDILLAKEFKKFIVDEHNRKIICFLTYYFNNCKLAEHVFPGKNYKIHKNLMICGAVGTGKTMLMQAFSNYLRKTRNPNFFHNLSVTQMINYYKQHNHLDRYTYNEENTGKFEGNPINVCLNDVGLQTHLHFGTDTKILVEDFFHARSEIWSQQRKYAHITTNMSPRELKEYFSDEYGRMADRLKFYNVIHLGGDSRRE